mgnify:CR=1 FL=1
MNLQHLQYYQKEQLEHIRFRGIGAGFVPDTLNTKIYDEVITIENEDAFTEGRAFAHSEGILVGISSGAALKASYDPCRETREQRKDNCSITSRFRRQILIYSIIR